MRDTSSPPSRTLATSCNFQPADKVRAASPEARALSETASGKVSFEPAQAATVQATMVAREAAIPLRFQVGNFELTRAKINRARDDLKSSWLGLSLGTGVADAAHGPLRHSCVL